MARRQPAGLIYTDEAPYSQSNVFKYSITARETTGVIGSATTPLVSTWSLSCTGCVDVLWAISVYVRVIWHSGSLQRGCVKAL